MSSLDSIKKSEFVEEINKFECYQVILISKLDPEPIKLNVKIKPAGNNFFIGVADLKIRGKNGTGFYQSIHQSPTKDGALRDAIDGFESYLSEEFEVIKAEDW